MSFQNNWNTGNKWKRKDSIKKEAHMKNQLRTGGYSIQGEEGRRKVCNNQSLFSARTLNYPFFHQMRQRKILHKNCNNYAQSSWIKVRQLVTIMTFFFVYMTDFIFVFNALLLGNSGFTSESKAIELCSSSAKHNIFSFPSFKCSLGS